MPNAFCSTTFSSLYSKRLFVLLVALWVLTLAGIQSVPLETHESFVLGTTQEMKSSGDWILPRYNSELRLNKPPLNYWATLLVSAIDPVHSDIQIYHGRAVSLLAVLLMVLLTARTGGTLYGRETGLLAALLLVGTNGVLSLSHNAKPDVLYAALCTLQLFSWIDAWRADSPVRQKRSALLGWFAAGLATLTKGPQVPAVFLLGLTAFLVSGPDRRRVFKILRPLSGSVLFCILALPWWVLIQHRLRTLGVDISDSQLSGSLLHNLASWRELMSFYYVWLPVVQMLPASLLILLYIPRLVKNRTAMQPSTRLLAYVSTTMLLLFTLGGHYRRHYMLPLFPVFSILLASGVRLIPYQGMSEKLQKRLSVAGLVSAVACAGCMVWRGEYGMVALFAVLGALIFSMLKQELAGALREIPVFTKQLLAMAAALGVLGAGFNAYRPTQQWPAAQQEFKRCVGAMLSERDRLVCWKTSVNVLPYYAKQQVRAFDNEGDLVRYLTALQNVHAVYAVLPTRELPPFGELFKTRLVRSVDNNGESEKGLSFVEILGAQEGRLKR